MNLFRKMLLIALPPTILVVILAGLGALARLLALPEPIPSLFSVTLAVILSSVYVGLIAHRRGFDRAWGLVPTMIMISLIAQVVVVAMKGLMASIFGTAIEIEKINQVAPGDGLWFRLLIAGLFEGLVLSVPAVIIYYIIRHSEQAAQSEQGSESHS